MATLNKTTLAGLRGGSPGGGGRWAKEEAEQGSEQEAGLPITRMGMVLFIWNVRGCFCFFNWLPGTLEWNFVYFFPLISTVSYAALCTQRAKSSGAKPELDFWLYQPSAAFLTLSEP